MVYVSGPECLMVFPLIIWVAKPQTQPSLKVSPGVIVCERVYSTKRPPGFGYCLCSPFLLCNSLPEAASYRTQGLRAQNNTPTHPHSLHGPFNKALVLVNMQRSETKKRGRVCIVEYNKNTPLTFLSSVVFPPTSFSYSLWTL